MKKATKKTKNKPVAKMTKKEKDEMLLKLREDQLKRTKEIYNNYLEAIVRYNDGDLGLYAIRAHQMFQDNLNKRLRECVKDKKSFMTEVFGKPGQKKLTETQIIESSIEYYEGLIETAKLKINNFDHKIRMRMASDSIKYFNLYMKRITDEAKRLSDVVEKEGEQ